MWRSRWRRRLRQKKYDCGILICGTGIGVSLAANKVKGAYAALAYDTYTAQRARLSNDANILCMGSAYDRAEDQRADGR